MAKSKSKAPCVAADDPVWPSHLIGKVMITMEAMRVAWKDADERTHRWAFLGMETGGFENCARDERATLSRPIDDFWLSVNIALPYLSETLARDAIRWGHRFVASREARSFWSAEWDEDFRSVYLLLHAERERNRGAAQREIAETTAKEGSPTPSKIATEAACRAADNITKALGVELAKLQIGAGSPKPLRLIPLAAAAKQLGTRADRMKKALEARGHIIHGKKRHYSAEFEAIRAMYPRLRGGFTTWADKNFPPP